VFGFRLWDKVKFDGRDCFVKGRRTSGYFALAMLEGTKVTDSAHYKKLKLLETAKHYLTERREGSPPMTEVTGVRAEIT
ncbi:MAG: HNH endonuclease, partial [Clostridia bacterium]|nr:HNH endonuclease [Clostridia bacterium]